MKKRTMRGLALLLALVMVFTVLPVTVLAEETAVSAALVTDASELKADDQIVIAAKNSDVALSTNQKNNNRGQAAVTKNGNSLTGGSDVQIITLKSGTVANTFAFYVGTGYLYAASSSSNHLKTQTNNNGNGSWTIEIAADGTAMVKAQGTNTRNWLRYNNNTSNGQLFSCYASGQQDILIYKVGGGETPDPGTDPEKPTIVDIKTALANSGGVESTVKGVVTLVDGKNIYVQDATGGICLRFDTEADISLGDTIIGTGKRATYNGVPQLGSATFEPSSGLKLEAKAASIGNLSMDDFGTYVAIDNVEVTEVYDNNGGYSNPNITVKDTDGKTIQLYKAIINKNDGAWEYKVGDKLDIKAAVSCYQKDNQGTMKLQLRNTNANEIKLHEEGPIADGDKVVIYNPANMKALSTVYNGFYNTAKDVTLGEDGKLSGYTDAEIWTVGKNADGTFTFSTSDGKKLSMGNDNYTSMPLGEVNDSWEVSAVEGKTGRYYIDNAGRKSGKFYRVEWDSRENFLRWSAYYGTGKLFEQAFYKVTDSPDPGPGPEPTPGIIENGNYVIYNPAKMKALSSAYSGNYNQSTTVALEDGVLTGYTASDIWNISKNDDGTYTIATLTGGKLSMGTSHTSMPLNEANDAWKITAVDGADGKYYIDNTGRTDKYRVQYYESKGTWSAYTGTGDLFEQAFYKVTDVPDPDTPDALADGTYFIYSPKAGGIMRYASGGKAGMLPVTIDEETSAVTFTGQSNGAGLYEIKKVSGKDYYTIQLGNHYLGENAKEDFQLTDATSDTADLCTYWYIRPTKGGYNIQNKTVQYKGKDTYMEYYPSNGFCMYTAGNLSDIMFTMQFYPADSYKNEPQDPAGYLGKMPPSGELPTSGATYVVYNEYAASVMGPQNAEKTAPSLLPVAATITQNEAGLDVIEADNGARIFTVEEHKDGSTTYYTFKTGDTYLASSENVGNENEENLLLQKDLTDYCYWTLEQTEGGYVMYNKLAAYKSNRVCIEYFSSVFSGWTYKAGTAELFAMRFYPVTDTYEIGYVVNPKVKITTTSDANQGLDFPVNFKLDDYGAIQNVTASVSFDGEEASKTCAVTMNGYNGTALIPEADLKGHSSLTITISATSKQENGMPASYSASKTFQIVDEPLITAVSPAALSRVSAGQTTITADFVNAGDEPTVTMSVNGTEAQTTVSGGHVSAAVDVTEGTTSVAVTVTRKDGKTVTKTWSFYCGVGTRVPYFGQVHSHTAQYSDGSGTLEDAYAHARGAKQVDFLFVTDHSNYFDTTASATQSTMFDASGLAKWQEALSTASKYASSTKTDGSGAPFIGAYGYEMTWSGGGPGHINTFNSSGIVSRNETGLNDKTNNAGLFAYYDLMVEADAKNCRQVTTQPIISQFNHPGTTFGNFNDYVGWTAERDTIMNLIEVGNGEGAVGSNGYFPSYNEYDLALSKGWHVAPTNNQDNHKGGWGDANTCRTVILADEFDLDGVYEAMSSRYVYSTEDNNLSVIYTMLDTDGKQLALQGDVVAGHESDTDVTLNVAISDADVEPIGRIEVIGESGKVLATVQNITSNTYTWTETINNSSSYYYIRVTQPDGDIAVTAPIWVNAVAATRVTAKAELTRNNTGMADVGAAEALQAVVTNTGSDSLTVNSYKIYVDGKAVEDKTLSGVTLAGGAKHELSYSWTPAEGGSHTVRVEFSVTQDKTTILVSASKKIYVKGSDYGTVSKIADAKNGALYQEFTVEGILTANTSGYDKDTAFFDCTYVQDETGGINIFPVSGNYRLGQKVRVHGAITYYCGEIELNLSEDYGGYIEVIDPAIDPVAPAKVTCAAAMSDENIGLLMQVSGTITKVHKSSGIVDRIYVDDGSGEEAMFYINGYILNSKNKTTSFTGDEPEVGAKITGIGIGSRDADELGEVDPLRRLRVRDRSELVITKSGSSDPDQPVDPGKPGKPSKIDSPNRPKTERELPFADVRTSDWFYDDVKYVYESGIMDGVGTAAFAPNQTLTRAMIVTILYRMEKTPAVFANAPFTDVPSGKWYSDAVAWAAKEEIVNGYGDGLFGPNDPITREQLAAILFRYAVYRGMTAVTLEENLSSFPDAAQIASYAVPAMNWSVGQGLLNGSGGRLAPKAHATRAQVAAIIHRYLEK